MEVIFVAVPKQLFNDMETFMQSLHDTLRIHGAVSETLGELNSLKFTMLMTSENKYAFVIGFDIIDDKDDSIDMKITLLFCMKSNMETFRTLCVNIWEDLEKTLKEKKKTLEDTAIGTTSK